MLTRENKVRNAQEFIKSTKFGIETFTTIYLFKINLQYAILCIKLNGILQNKLKDKNIAGHLREDELLRVKQTMTLDVIAKIEILIESTLILIDAISAGYKLVPQRMTRYPTNLIPKIIKNIKKKKYNLSKNLGLPKIDKLPISLQERKFLGLLFSESAQSLERALLELIEFYEHLSIIYGKSKHGLTFVLCSRISPNEGSILKSLNSEFLIHSIDRRQKTGLPSGYIVSNKRNETFSFPGPYFNTMSILKFGNLLFKKIATINSILNQVVGFICDSHLTYATNSGEGYLPVVWKEKKVGVRMFTLNWNRETQKELLKIFKKILPNMNIDEPNLQTVFDTKNPDIIDSLLKNVVTNIWFSESTRKKY